MNDNERTQRPGSRGSRRSPARSTTSAIGKQTRLSTDMDPANRGRLGATTLAQAPGVQATETGDTAPPGDQINLDPLDAQGRQQDRSNASDERMPSQDDHVHDVEAQTAPTQPSPGTSAPLPPELRLAKGVLPELAKAPDDGGARFRAYSYSSVINIASAASWKVYHEAPFAQPMCQSFANAVRNGFGFYSDLQQSKYVRSAGQLLSSCSQVMLSATQLASHFKEGPGAEQAHAASLGIYGSGQLLIGAADLADPDKRVRGATYLLASGTNFASAHGYAHTAEHGSDPFHDKLQVVANTSNAVTSMGGAVAHGQAAYANYKELKQANSPESSRKRIWMKVLGQAMSSMGYVMNSYAQVAVHLIDPHDPQQAEALKSLQTWGGCGMMLVVIGQQVTGIGDLYKVKAPKKDKGKAPAGGPLLEPPADTAAPATEAVTAAPPAELQDDHDVPPPNPDVVAQVEAEFQDAEQRGRQAQSPSAPLSRRASPRRSHEAAPEDAAVTSESRARTPDPDHSA